MRHDINWEVAKPFASWQVETCSAEVIQVGRAIDLHKFMSPQNIIEQAADRYEITSGVPIRAEKIIPFAAEKYNISKHLREFAAVPVIIMPSDLPNRNKVGFPLSRLSEFDPNLGCLMYESWRHKPTFFEHANDDWTKAKGIVLDVGMRPIKEAQGNLWKVNALLAFDRSRDPVLVNKILTGELNSYSMGAYVGNYSCSICGTETSRKDQPLCEHIDPRNPSYQIYNVRDKPRLAHWNTGAGVGFEVSCVNTPAFLSALGRPLGWGDFLKQSFH